MRASSLAAALVAAAAALTVSACGPSATEGTSASPAAGEPPAAATPAAIAEPIRLDAGLLAGGTSSSANVRVYKGIPFAAPPVGELRWAAPQPVAKWDGTRDASEFGNICIQPPGPTEGPQARLNIAVLPDSPPMAEDCLYLNVWTGAAAATERRPVMVYFFGGAFTEGSGSVPLYDGDALAQKGAVVVTMNYRLGPYGFFVHPALTADSPHKASGNYGLMDMLASLRWVKSNIAAFGGDPDNVTRVRAIRRSDGDRVARRVARGEGSVSIARFRKAVLGWGSACRPACARVRRRRRSGSRPRTTPASPRSSSCARCRPMT